MGQRLTGCEAKQPHLTPPPSSPRESRGHDPSVAPRSYPLTRVFDLYRLIFGRGRLHAAPLSEHMLMPRPGDASTMHSALLALIKLPATSLLHTRGGKKKRRGIRALLQRLRKVAERSVSDVASQQLQSVDIPDPSDPVAARLSRARALIQQGHVGRAARSLFQEPLPPVDEKTIELLHSLHPESSGPAPALPVEAPTVQQVDQAALARLVRSSLANGAAPGGSGWTGDLLKALIDDHDCLSGLAILVRTSLMGSSSGVPVSFFYLVFWLRSVSLVVDAVRLPWERLFTSFLVFMFYH